jgi:PrtD family type I secretion system ABC transporter
MEHSNVTNLEKILSNLRPVWISVCTNSFFINLLILPVSLYSLQVMDRVLSTGSTATLLWLTVIMLAMFAAAGLLQTLRSMVLQKAADWLHDSIAEVVLPLVLAQSAAGGKGAQHLRDASTIKQFIAGNGLVTLMDTPWSILYIAALFIVHWSLGLLVIVGAILLLFMAWLNETSMRRPSQEAGIRQLRAMQELELATRNAEVTQAMGMVSALSTRWKAMQKTTSELQTKAGGRAAVIQGGTKFLRLSLQILVTCAAAWLAIYGHVTIGAIIAASILASRALAPFEAAIASWKSFTETRLAYYRLKKAFTDEVQQEPMKLPDAIGAIAVENIIYSAEGREEPILKNVNFSLNAGEILGIVGPSGSGKSTLARVIMGVWQAEKGVVRLDGADIRHWSRTEFGRSVGYLPQDVELFSGTIKDNISRFNTDATPEAVVQAANMASAHELILRLPKGYDTEIGQGGAILSAGQRQRIGLARAFYGDPRLLMLDEPDASLDDVGQQALVAALYLAKQRKITTLLITHRNNLLEHVDKLLVLRDGRLEAIGQISEVMAMYNKARVQITPGKGNT